MVEKCITDCQKEFLRHFRSQGLRPVSPAPAYGENRLTMADSRGYAALQIVDDPAGAWSGPPRLRITMFRGRTVRVAEVCMTRHFPGKGPRSPREIIRALPGARLSFTLVQQDSRGRQSFESFDALLAFLDSVDS